MCTVSCPLIDKCAWPRSQYFGEERINVWQGVDIAWLWFGVLVEELLANQGGFSNGLVPISANSTWLCEKFSQWEIE